MTIDEVITVLSDKDVSIRWDGMCYSLRLRNILHSRTNMTRKAKARQEFRRFQLAG